MEVKKEGYVSYYKNKILRIGTGLAFLVTSLGYAPAVNAAETVNHKPNTTIEQRVQQEQLPYYLKGLNRPTDQFEMLKEIFNIYGEEMWKQKIVSKQIVNDSYNFESEFQGKKTNYILLNHRQEGDKVVKYSPFGRDELSLEEVELIKKDLINVLEKAATIAYNKHKHIQPEVLKLAGENLGVEDLESKLSLVEKSSGLTYGQILNFPYITIQDFIPRKLFFGVSPGGSLAVTYLNSGVVIYNPFGRKLDYISEGFSNEPSTLIHEFVHANPKLQNMPIAFQVDMELFASFPWLENLELTDYFLHPYFERIREMNAIFFGFDTNKSWEEIVEFTYGGREGNMLGRTYHINEQALKKYVQVLKRIGPELSEVSMKKVLPEFYSDQLFWLAVGAETRDQSIVFDIILAKHFDPTLLQDPEGKLSPHEYTTRWIKENSAKIEDVINKTWEQMESETGEDYQIKPLSDGMIMSLARKLNLQEKDIERIRKEAESYGIKSFDDLKNKDLPVLMKIILGGLK